MLGGTTRAWVSASHQSATDWVNSAAENERDHLAAKFVTEFDRWNLTGYLSYDDTHEDNYQRLFSPDEFVENDSWDRLTAEWSGIPYIDQVYRKGWSTLRTNTFGYLKAEAELAEGLNVSAGVYFHQNKGRGDWVPPYLINVRDDQGGPESELGSGPQVEGGGARPDLLRRWRRQPPHRCRGLRILHHLPLRRCWGRLRPRLLPRRGHRGAVLPPHPLREAAPGLYRGL